MSFLSPAPLTFVRRTSTRTRVTVLFEPITGLPYIRLWHLVHERSRQCCSRRQSPGPPGIASRRFASKNIVHPQPSSVCVERQDSVVTHWSLYFSRGGQLGLSRTATQTLPEYVDHLRSDITPTQTDVAREPPPTETFQTCNMSTTLWVITGLSRSPTQTDSDLARRTRTPVTAAFRGVLPE